MRLKQIISLIVIIIALGGAGVFVYMIMSSPAPIDVTNSPSSLQTLPHGNNMNFDTVKKFNKTGRLFQYPSVTPVEAGLPLNQIIQQ